MEYYIRAKSYLLEEAKNTPRYLHVRNGFFGLFYEEPPLGANVVDWGEYTIAPGLFDTHIHGVAGADVMDGSVEAIHHISKAIASNGVTRFLPTTLTTDNESLERALVSIKKAIDDGVPGAAPEGIFLEGPFFTEPYQGAQNPKYFMDPNLELFQYWQQLADDHIIKIALAPERSSTVPFIRSVTNNSVTVSIAHSDANANCCHEAEENGASIYVHLFNGMRGIHHRELGVAGAALLSENAYAELICDGYHVHSSMVKLIARIKQDHIVLITDCMRAGKMEDGEYMLGESKVQVKNGLAQNEEGSLAGSTLQLIDAVKNFHQWTGVPLSEVWHLASLTPAKSIGKDDELGSIEQGKKADYVVLDGHLQPLATFRDGMELKGGSMHE